MTDKVPPEADPPERFGECELVLLWSAGDRAELESEALTASNVNTGHLEALLSGQASLKSRP